ncbi:hemerythrin domain-containing protein [Halobacillus seohaensis]|uniref:Hemerythrin domain-containing protein n=1 Tax=Halobacillus seohaensis TaxID=447421 RepID=A0ABW2EF68_9BACI
MKRHEALHPLSHHHHHALVVAQQLKKTDEHANKQEQRRSVINFWQKDGAIHFRDEEEVLLPLYAQYASVDQEPIKQMLMEHVQIRALIARIRTEQRLSVEQFQNLGELLDNHVRLEERVIFPMIQEAVPENLLYLANGQFHRDSYSGM